MTSFAVGFDTQESAFRRGRLEAVQKCYTSIAWQQTPQLNNFLSERTSVIMQRLLDTPPLAGRFIRFPHSGKNYRFYTILFLTFFTRPPEGGKVNF
jgi:hypothetical protein